MWVTRRGSGEHTKVTGGADSRIGTGRKYENIMKLLTADRMVASRRERWLWPGRAVAGRKVRTPQSSVPDNVRDGGDKPAGRKVPQKTYRRGREAEVRVKRCGKSAPPGERSTGQGKPHTEQDQIGEDGGGNLATSRLGSSARNGRPAMGGTSG